MRGDIRLDLAVYEHAVSHGKLVLERKFCKGAMPLTESGGYGVPRDIVLPTTTITFLGEDIACPNKSKDILVRAISSSKKGARYAHSDKRCAIMSASSPRDKIN